MTEMYETPVFSDLVEEIAATGKTKTEKKKSASHVDPFCLFVLSLTFFFIFRMLKISLFSPTQEVREISL